MKTLIDQDRGRIADSPQLEGRGIDSRRGDVTGHFHAWPDFHPEKVVLLGCHTLQFSVGEAYHHGMRVTVNFSSALKRCPIAGETIHFTPGGSDGGYDDVSVNLAWWRDGASGEVRYVGNLWMNLVFGDSVNGGVFGQIYLRLPWPSGEGLVGEFIADTMR